MKQYNHLLDNIRLLLESSRQQVVREINRTVVITYWDIGRYIVEYEQGGKERATYGSRLLKRLSEDLTESFGKGYSYRNLQLAKKFYNTFPIVQSLIAQSLSGQDLKPVESALLQASWTHLVRLLSINNETETERNFYLLETAIISNLEKFLLELGKGFSFVARQYRISSGADHFSIDLVFYNRLLQCHVLIDLKIGKLKHQDNGQMQMYVNYFDREIKTNFESPTIGIILCKEKNDFIIEYSLPVDNNQIFPRAYQLYLPDKAELKKLLSKNV